MHTQLVDYFSGVWSNGRLKPYKNRKGKSGMADRFVAKQPLVFKEGSEPHNGPAGHGERTVFNLRKMAELVYHLCKASSASDISRLKDEVLFNFDWLYEKSRATGFIRSVKLFRLQYI